MEMAERILQSNFLLLGIEEGRRYYVPSKMLVASGVFKDFKFAMDLARLGQAR